MLERVVGEKNILIILKYVHLFFSSALVVRFLTKRYIGEYDHKEEKRYKNEVLVDGDPVIFEIVDLCPRHNDDLPSLDTLTWADGVVLVYSITDRASFNFIKQVWNIFQVSFNINHKKMLVKIFSWF